MQYTRKSSARSEVFQGEEGVLESYVLLRVHGSIYSLVFSSFLAPFPCLHAPNDQRHTDVKQTEGWPRRAARSAKEVQLAPADGQTETTRAPSKPLNAARGEDRRKTATATRTRWPRGGLIIIISKTGINNRAYVVLASGELLLTVHSVTWTFKTSSDIP